MRNTDQWDSLLLEVKKMYGEELANKISTMIDEGQIEEVILTCKWLGIKETTLLKASFQSNS